MISREFLRFLVAGASNTLVAYLCYLLLVIWLPYPVAWGIGYLLGIASGYVVNTIFVFNKPMHRKSAAGYAMVYAGQYLVSVFLLKIALEYLKMPHWLAALAVIVLTIVPTFLFVRLTMSSK